MKNIEDSIQILLFQKISDQLPSHISLVDEISEILEITADSAYRRIRGDKPLSIYEVRKLCNNYRISFDDMVNTGVDAITFRSNLLEEATFSFENFLETMLKHFQFFEQNSTAEIVFILNELNILQLMQFPDLFAFKLFFWQKSNLGFPGYKEKLFSMSSPEENNCKLAMEINDYYVKTKTIELTTEESLNSFLKQILFYHEAGFFESKEDAKNLCKRLLDLTDHLKRQAELGFKFKFGSTAYGEEDNFMLYYNDIILTDNTILVAAGNNKISFVTNNAINLLYTFNKNFYDYNYQWFNNIKQKSSLISGVAERERSKYFISLRKKVQYIIDNI